MVEKIDYELILGAKKDTNFGPLSFLGWEELASRFTKTSPSA